MRFSLIIIALIFLTGCGKPDSLMRATLFNQTDHDIKICFFQNGLVAPSDTIRLPPNSQFLLAYTSGKGNGTGRGFNSDYSGDSVVVIFDNEYPITHYVNDPVNFAKHYYLFGSTRNINNPYSYVFMVMHDNGTVNDHKYYFTEQDYLDAKD